MSLSNFENSTSSQAILHRYCYSENSSLYPMGIMYVYFTNYLKNIQTYHLDPKIAINHMGSVVEKTIQISQQKKKGGNSEPKIIVCVDLQFLTVALLDTKLIADMVNHLQMKYPEILYCCYVYHVPTFFSNIYGLVSKLLDRRTRSKIHVVSEKSQKKMHLDHDLKKVEKFLKQ